MNHEFTTVVDGLDLESYLGQTSALELARRSLIGAPVYAFVSLIILFGTPILSDYGTWAAMEAILLVLLGVLRFWFALGFERRYAESGERAVLQFSILTALQSLTFGVMAALVVWHYWNTQEAVLTVVLAAGCIAAGTSALSVRRSAQSIFLGCVLLPLCVAVFLVGGLTKALLILGFLMLMALLVQDGGQARRVYLEHLKNRFEHDVEIRRQAIENQARREFLNDIGHEIRTPLTSIVGMTSLLQNDNPSARGRECLELIRRSCAALEGRLNDVQGAIRSRPDIQAAQSDSVDIAACLKRILGLYRSQANARAITLSAHLDDLPGTVRLANVNYLEQVVSSLLDNAIKHTRNGSVSIRTCCRKLRDDEVEIEVCIADTGCGIRPDRLDTLFGSFGPPAGRPGGNPGGNGLGLPICKGLVELLGGEIRVDSEPGAGTQAIFTLRAGLSEAAASWQPETEILGELPLRACRDLSGDSPLRILVVEDHPINRRMLCQFLSNLGYQVDEAEDGQAAVAATLGNTYDLVFMDIRMPTMNGIEATRWIRQYAQNAGELRVVALSGDVASETRQQCLAAGMDDFFPKPIRLEDMEAILRIPSKAA